MGKPSEVRVLGVYVGGVLAVVMLAGCQGTQVLMNAEHLDDGLVIVLPGIDGRTPHSRSICRAIGAQRPDFAVELYDWTLPLGLALNQCAVGRNRAVAEHLAKRIVAYRRDHRGRPVFLVGHSGGTAIAVWAAEALPEREAVDRIVLLASSLSPEYDLTGALRHSSAGIVSFYSRQDSLLLGLGTSLFGTMDGRHCEAAGKVGFRREGRSYGGLREIAWRPEMAASGHGGGHFACAAEGFVSAYVVPLVGTMAAASDMIAAAPGMSEPPAGPGPGR